MRPAPDLGGRRGDLKADLSKARYGTLANVDFSSQNPADALGLSPEAPYYLSFVFDGMGRPEQSLRMLELAWDKSPEPWKDEAGILLAQQLVRMKSYDKAVELARRLVVPGGSPDREQRARRVLVEALYPEQERCRGAPGSGTADESRPRGPSLPRGELSPNRARSRRTT